MDSEIFFTQPKDEAFFTKIDEDLDYAFALSLQEDDVLNINESYTEQTDSKSCSSEPIGIIDEQWEVIDPNPDIHALFLQYNSQFFYGKLEGVEVRWSPRMTLCAGLCCYEGRGGLCSVRLSLPLLKLRPRKDLVETLLHEMIHAYLFVTVNNKDRDAHGPEFLKHMNRINKEAGTKISVYHSFHDEVDLYRKHWWKCNGPCQKRRPFFGLVKRAMNRAPGPHDTWWSQHQASCGGEFIKIKEPENVKKKSLKRKPVKSEKPSLDIKNFFPPSPPADAFKDNSEVSKMLKKSHDIDLIKSVFEKEDNCISLNNGSASSSQRHVNSITPFTGQGYQLGSSSSSQPRSFLANLRRELASSSNMNLNSRNSVNSSSTEETKKEDVKGYVVNKTTIENECSRLVQSSIQKYVSSPKQASNPSSQVECPVCFQSFTEIDINSHLDTCLSKGC